MQPEEKHSEVSTGEEEEEKEELKVQKFIREDYTTRTWVFKLICQEFEVQPEVDLFADAANRRCEKYFDVQLDALKMKWPEDKVLWANPPWSGIQGQVYKVRYTRAVHFYKPPPLGV